MPILLDTPLIIPPRHGHAGGTFNEIKISAFFVSLETEEAFIDVQYGNTVDGVWVGAPTAIVEKLRLNVVNTEDQVDRDENVIPGEPSYDILTETPVTSATGVPVYAEMKASLYAYLMAEIAEYAGVIQ
jgi:hypothetical protein